MLTRAILLAICVLMGAAHSAQASFPRSESFAAIRPKGSGPSPSNPLEAAAPNEERIASIREEAQALDEASLESAKNPSLAAMKEELTDVHAGMSKIVRLIDAIAEGRRGPAPEEELSAWEGYIAEARGIMNKTESAS